MSNQPNNGGIVKRKLLLGAGVAGSSLILAASPALADDAADPAVYLQAVMDNLWVFIAGILVFFMQAGFALVEAGLTRSKNVANIMAKNIADMSGFYIALTSMIIGVQLFLAGFIAEMVSRNSYDRSNYQIEKEL